MKVAKNCKHFFFLKLKNMSVYRIRKTHSLLKIKINITSGLFMFR